MCAITTKKRSERRKHCARWLLLGSDTARPPVANTRVTDRTDYNTLRRSYFSQLITHGVFALR